MALRKVNYEDAVTVITAENLNEIQNEIITNGQAIEEKLPKSGGEVTGDLTVRRVSAKPKGDGYAPCYRFLDSEGVVRGAVALASTNKVYVQNNCPDTEYSEYFFTPEPDAARTKNGNFYFLTSKEAVTVNQGGTGAKTPEGARENIGAAKKTPSLSEDRKTALTTLASAYVSQRSYFKYDGSCIRNIYTGSPEHDSPFDANGKIKTNCGLLVGLIWAGVKPETFTKHINNQSAFDGTLEMVEGFDWGYQFLYPYRSAYGVKRENGDLYGFLQPNDPDYTGSSSYNSYYDPTVTNRTDKQRFFSFATAADMAAEMFARGFEVPLREVEVGDILFYNCRSLVDNLDDDAESFRFRNITHVAMVTRVDKKDQGSIRVVESTSMYGASIPITSSAPDMPDTVNKLRGIHLMNHIVMAARHPAAFGVAPNIVDRFNVI